MKKVIIIIITMTSIRRKQTSGTEAEKVEVTGRGSPSERSRGVKHEGNILQKTGFVPPRVAGQALGRVV